MEDQSGSTVMGTGVQAMWLVFEGIMALWGEGSGIPSSSDATGQ